VEVVVLVQREQLVLAVMVLHLLFQVHRLLMLVVVEVVQTHQLHLVVQEVEVMVVKTLDLQQRLVLPILVEVEVVEIQLEQMVAQA
jgi:hypothetical protein